MKIRFLVAGLAALLSTSVMADGFYVLGDVTRSSVSMGRSTFDDALTNAGAAALGSNDSGGSTQWRLQGGYDFNDNFAVEAGYMDLGHASYSATYTGGTASGKLKSGGADVAVLGKLPLNDALSVFAKAGIVAARTESTLNASAPAAAASGKASTSEIAPLLGLGVGYKLSDALELRTEYDNVSGLGKKGKTGTMDSNMLSVGIAYHF
jgi:OOP family OmpA-OmpF porin